MLIGGGGGHRMVPATGGAMPLVAQTFLSELHTSVATTMQQSTEAMSGIVSKFGESQLAMVERIERGHQEEHQAADAAKSANVRQLCDVMKTMQETLVNQAKTHLVALEAEAKANREALAKESEATRELTKHLVTILSGLQLRGPPPAADPKPPTGRE